MTSPVLLIDGDLYLHRACSAVERDVRWDEQNHVLVANFAQAWETLVKSLDRIFERFDTRDHVLALSTVVSPVFRLKVDQTYKSHRAETRKPLCYFRARKQLEEEYNVVCFDGLEADDVCGILATKPGDRERIICSTDKDMKTIPATVWDRKDLRTYTEAEANYWHLYQTLTGDTTDGYKGCPGVGKVKAEKLLTNDDDKDKWSVVVAAYAHAGLTEDAALVQARLARILRWSDWDSEKKEPILWTP